MAKKWTIKEDIIVCQFVSENHWRYISAEMLYELIADLQEAGFEARSIIAVDKRTRDFQKLFWEMQSPYASEQVRMVYQSFTSKDNENLMGSIRSCIAEIYNPNEIAQEYGRGTNLEGNSIGLMNYACSVDFAETFPMVLQKFIDKKEIKKNKEIYNRIFMKADTFSAILRGKYPVVKKENVLRLCVGLQLSVDEAEEFMESAGYLFSRGIMTDVVVKTCLAHQCYNPLTIDEELCEHNAPALFGVA